MPTCFVESKQAPKMTAVILGKCDQEDEATLTLIKTARLISTCWDTYGTERQLTWRHIVAAIRQLDDQSHKAIINSGLSISEQPSPRKILVPWVAEDTASIRRCPSHIGERFTGRFICPMTRGCSTRPFAKRFSMPYVCITTSRISQDPAKVQQRIVLGGK